MGLSAFFVPDEWLLLAATVIALSSMVIVACSKGYRNAVWYSLRTPRRRTSNASTPPPSFPPSADFVNSFPPSRRSALLELITKDNLIRPEPSLEALEREALSATNSYSFEKDITRYTPTGFSTTEIKALGDFPAYDILSGVPLPQPYKNFNAGSALPRPYRPLRWVYHQTMGMSYRIFLLWDLC